MAGGSETSTADIPSQGLPQSLHFNRGVIRRKSHAPPEKYDEENDPIPDEQEEGPEPVKFRHVFEGLFHNSHHGHTDHSEQVDIEHYIHDKSFRRRLFLLSLSNSTIGIRLQTFRTFLFVIGCLLYVAEATYYDFWGDKIDFSEYNSTLQREWNKILRFILYTDKPVILWIFQVCVGFIGLVGTCLQLYARVNDVSIRGVIKEFNYIVVIQLTIGIMYAITLLYPPVLRNLFVPLFLLCWPGRQAFSAAIIQSASRQFGIAPKTFTIKAMALGVFLICFTFTWVCLLHRVELVNTQLSLFDTTWFVLVTLSSVGYGDIHPNDYTGKFLVMLFIILGFIVILPQLEELYNAFQMQKRLHNSVNYTDSGKHVILCSLELKPMVLRDFLAEFFSDPKNLDVHCVVLVEKELSPFIMMYLSHPVWSTRITVLIGSPMKRTDLARARVDTAIACFIHTSRSSLDPEISDQHTVLSAWSVKNASPNCRLYVHVLLPETRMHLDLADQVMCEREVKLALMANHIHCPGISTLVTLLLHTFKSEVHNLSSADYHLYDMCSSCEVYDARVGDSKYFHYFIGKNYLYASVVAYRRYQVTLLGVRPRDSTQILLNPGLHYVLDEDDICYYIGFTREEYSKVCEAPSSPVWTAIWQTCANVALLSLSVAGIDTEQLRGEDGETREGETREGEAREGETREGEARADGDLSEGLTTSADEEARERERIEPVSSEPCVHFFIPSDGEGERTTEEEGELLASGSTSGKHSTGDGNTPECSYTVVKRGLNLLRFHSRIDVTANPVVKVTVTTAVPEEEEDVFGTHLARPRDNILLIEEGRGLKPPLPDISTIPPKRRRRRSLYRSMSDSSLSDLPTPTRKEQRIMYSSQLSLVKDSGSKVNGSLTDDPTSGNNSRFFYLSGMLRRMSTWTSHRPSIGTVDFKGSQEVVLNLEDVVEEKELEKLEDGRCGGDEQEEESGDEDTDIATALPQPQTPTATTCISHRYVKGCLPRLPYCGCDPVRFHLLPERRPHHTLHIDKDSDEPESSLPEKAGVSRRWYRGGVIVYSEEATEELYHLLLPLRAHYLHTAELRHILLLLGREPSSSFLELVAPLPMVHYLTGDVGCLDTWLRAGVLVCESVVIICSKRSSHDQEHIVDAAHILAAQKIAKLFPHVNVMTELHYRYNMRFLQPDNYIMSGADRRGDHLTYLFQPQFVAGRTFCASMLDTMLYQSHFKPYIISLVRQLLGCQQANDSAYLWKLEVGEELLKLQTYDRLFQRVVTVHHCVPLGLYRSVPLPSCPIFQKYYSERLVFDCGQYDKYLRSRLEAMGELDDDVIKILERRQSVPTQSFVLVNPPHKTHLQEGDVLLTLRPHHPPSHPPPQTHLPPPPPPPSNCDRHYPPTLPSPHNAVIVTAECH